MATRRKARDSERREIEAALSRHPFVQNAVVTLSEDEAGSRRLSAWVVARDRGQLSVGELRGFLERTLPGQRIPDSITVTDRAPLTANGRVDRKALLEAGLAEPMTKKYVSVRTPAEQSLALIWSRVLGVERVGVNDNFFELGGDSILSIQVISQARKAGLALNTQLVFQYQTIAELAAHAGRPVSGVSEGLIRGPVPLTAIQRWFFALRPASPSHFNQSLLLETPADVNLESIRVAFDLLLEHHDALRMRFTRNGDRWCQELLGEIEPVEVIHIDLSALDIVLRDYALNEAADHIQASLDISSGPLLRAAFFQMRPAADPEAGRLSSTGGSLSPTGGRLLIVVHHLVIDGVSWRILIDDLISIHQRLHGGAPPEFPPKTTSFKEWAEQTERLAKSGDSLTELPYWTGPERLTA
ncbi:MAG: condensation domain-containing protein, partial [Blastocatellia bacterium]